MAVYRTKHVSATLLLTFIYLQFLTHQFIKADVAGNSPSIYTPIEDIVIDCGSSGNSPAPGDPRTWNGDIGSKFFPSQLLQNAASVPSRAITQSSTVADVPYVTARLSRSEFTYVIPVTPGPKFIRLYFYPALYDQNFSRSDAVFSVKAGGYTLLRDFNASVHADASGSDTIFREFTVFLEAGNGEKLNISFTPTNQTTYAFISGIEIVSMPDYLYYTPPPLNNQGGRGLPFIGQSSIFFPIENYTALEMVYRINIGGQPISAPEDTGMFRIWSKDKYWDAVEFAPPYDPNTTLNFSQISPYTAPKEVYETAQTMGRYRNINKSYNLTWRFPVDPQFTYMLRLHFCEFEPTVTKPGDRVFLIYIHDMIAEDSADVIQWAGGRLIPVFKDYVVSVYGNDKTVDLSVKLQANPDDWKTTYSNVILNGIEIFKLNDSSSNLGGQNPDPPRTTTQYSDPPRQLKYSKASMVKTIVISAVVGGVVFCLITAFVLGFFLLRRGRRYKDHTTSVGTTWWAPYSFSTTKSSKTRSTTLPSDVCRYFSLAEIKAATKDFDDIFVIGIGGFGNVYKGYIDDGATQVAIKRLKPGSKQGENEFRTEIEMLSQLRHLHLVSLIGYCNDGSEMILVYDYMSRGTLRDHLYGGDEPSLPWNRRLQICIGAARGLHYLHTSTKHTIIHRDVKTTNILLDEKWVAKVSDFGLSKVGPTSMSKAHVSTVVKGSFGYLDPEYYRRNQLTEKSDVYSFGVVLCEVLCARPPLKRTAEKDKVSLAEWVRRCNSDNTIAQIVDPKIKDEISPESLRKFVETAVSCIQDEGMHRPMMNDVVWALEFASQLQEASKKEFVVGNGGGGEEMGNEEGCLLTVSERETKEAMFSRSNGKELSDFTSSGVVITTSESSSFSHNNYTSNVFSEINEPKGR